MNDTLILSDKSQKNTIKNEVWIRISAFLSLKTPNTQKTYIGIIKEWTDFLGGEIGTEKGATLILSATDLHAISYKHFLEKKRGQAPRVKTSKEIKDISTRVYVNQKSFGTSYNLTTSTIAKKFTALRRLYRMFISSNLSILIKSLLTQKNLVKKGRLK